MPGKGLVSRGTFADSPGFTQDSRKIRGWIHDGFARFAMDSQDSRWIRRIRDGFAGFAGFARIRRYSQGFANHSRKNTRQIRKDSRRFTKDSQDSRWCHRVHMYTRTVNPRMNPLILLISHRAGRDDVPVPATPCFTVDADDADFFAGLAQVDPEGIGFIKKRCVGAFVTR